MPATDDKIDSIAVLETLLALLKLFMVTAWICNMEVIVAGSVREKQE